MLPCGSCRTREKILEGWKVYAGTSNLLQLPEAASISQIIINGNYTDEEDDYDIALMRLSKPLTLSGESQPPQLLQAAPGAQPCSIQGSQSLSMVEVRGSWGSFNGTSLLYHGKHWGPEAGNKVVPNDTSYIASW